MCGDALQTFKNTTSLNRWILREILTVFRKKCVKPQSIATTKQNFQRMVFEPANQNLIIFPDDLPKLSKDAFGVAAQAIIEHYMPKSLPSSSNQSTKRVWRMVHINRLYLKSNRN